ncbi:MAG: malonyl-CoA decarboxylase [Rhodobacteraceae bacterium]|nr:malonyl-CoA decarboxylase [Paracoccaceae bacterium]
MRKTGDASRVAVAEAALDAYGALASDAKAAFFRSLLSEYGAESAAIRTAFAAWDTAPSDAALSRLFAAVEPQRQTLLRRLNLATGGTLQLVRMRADLLTALRTDPTLAPLDADFAHLLASWFNRGFLVMRRIDWNSPAAILEKIVAYEAVHAIRDWDDLRRRLDPADRRCYGFFHPATGDEPLIFVEVALCRGIPDAIGPLLQAGGDADPGAADTAVFYSISNCQPGLKGVSFGNFLIKQVVHDLAQDLPQIRNFVTLSPAPGFAGWLARETAPEARALSATLTRGTWQTDAAVCAELAPRVRHWAARYFVEAKTAAGLPVDPVARFHLGNGAAAHRINWPADRAAGALRRGHGVMINYLYDVDSIEARHEAFVAEGTVACGPELRRALETTPPPTA